MKKNPNIHNLLLKYQIKKHKANRRIQNFNKQGKKLYIVTITFTFFFFRIISSKKNAFP